MKRYLLALMLVSTNASAIDPFTMLAVQVATPLVYYSGEPSLPDRTPVVVTASGVGKTCEQALNNAKTSALEKAVGVWMHGEAYSDMKSYDEKITQYSGGLIESYTVVSNSCNNVTIEATVVPRNNKIGNKSATVKTETLDLLQQKIANEKKRQIAIKEVNDRSKAIGFDIDNIEFKHSNSDTYLIVEGTMFFQDKWKHDYYDLKQQADDFNLTSFHKPIKLNLVGTNYNKKIFNTEYQLNYDGVDMYAIDTHGIVRVYPNKKDKIRLTFKVDSGIIMDVNKLEVKVL